MSSKESRQNWARLIQEIYEIDPLICPKCQGPMRILSFIEKLELIERILRHLGLWGISGEVCILGYLYMGKLEDIDDNKEIEVVNIYPADLTNLTKLAGLSGYDRVAKLISSIIPDIKKKPGLCIKSPVWGMRSNVKMC